MVPNLGRRLPVLHDPPIPLRVAPPLLLLWVFLSLLPPGAGGLVPRAFGAVSEARAEPRVIGRTESDVRILRGRTSAPVDTARTAAASADPFASLVSGLESSPPAVGDAEAATLARRAVAAFGGPSALAAWLGAGERRGRQTLLAPVRATSRMVERRQAGASRIDVSLGGVPVTAVTSPVGGWQRILGLVSDLPEALARDFEVLRAHDESLLLGAARGAVPARVGRGGEVAILDVWGARGSPTRFVLDPSSGQLRGALFRDVSALGGSDVLQSIAYDQWVELEPGGGHLRGPDGARAPLRAFTFQDGIPLQEVVIDTLDLLAVFDDSVFARPGSVEATDRPQARTVVPLERHDRHHFVRVTLAGAGERRFLVDTGAGLTAISREVAATLGLGPGAPLEVAGVGGAVAAGSVSLPALTVGTFTRRDVPCLVLDFDELRAGLGTDFDGILGFSALSRWQVTFDFAAGRLALVDGAPSRTPGPGGARLQCEFLGGQMLVRGRVDGRDDVDFLVDTGAWMTFVPRDVGQALSGEGGRKVPGVPYFGADRRPLEATAVRARSLTLGALRVDRPIVLYASGGGASDPTGLTISSGERGVLGADILTRYLLTLDYPRAELVLEKPVGRPLQGAADGTPTAGERFFRGPGLIPAVGPDGPRVAAVVTGSPAARAGVRPGSRRLALDGRPVEGLDAVTLLDRLAGDGTGSVRVRLAPSQGGERVVTLERVPLL